ncbi:FHIPEP family type III secretion protein, partial [Pseudomonas viridiflava]
MNGIIHLLNRLALAVMGRTEIVGAVMVMAIVFMMILPLPTWLVDVLIALNICISSLLIVLAMYLPRPLAFSTFPAVLLLTTMFRLSLSIATTRLILLQQDAGHIVEAFGSFVVGGNLAVGLVIFLILTIVNFLVITKGSERVAEVAARFTLDAMPGKQMSIDSDLRANLINVREARHRREQLSKESQLFGAMDGAMKFVKGDAIAGLV